MKLFLCAIFLLAGCTQSQTREQTTTDKTDRITVSGVVTVPTAEGPKPMPVTITVVRDGSETQQKESETKTAMDGAAIGQQIGAAAAAAISTAATGSGGSLLPGWSKDLLNAGMTAGIGWLALKKHQQMRNTRKTTHTA